MYTDFLCLDCDEQFSAHWPTHVVCPECGSLAVIEINSGLFAKMIEPASVAGIRPEGR